MSDIVERLRNHEPGVCDQLALEAADEITRLRDRIAQLEREQEAA